MRFRDYFDFGGELDRRGFLIGAGLNIVGTVAWGTAVVALVLVVVVIGTLVGLNMKPLEWPAAVVALALVAPPSLWMWFATCAKRARNIGINPAAIVSLQVAAGSIDPNCKYMVASFVAHPYFANFHLGSFASLCLQIFLLLWPAHGAGEAGGPPVHSPAPPLSRGVFGRRGAAS